MKQLILSGLATLMAGSVFAADPSPKDIVTNAAKKLGDTTNYSWKATVVVPESAMFKPEPTVGKTEKNGYTLLSMSFFNTATTAVLKDKKGVATNQDGQWVTFDDMEKEEGPGRFLGAIIRSVKLPAIEAAELAAAAKELKKDGEVYASDLTDEGAKVLQTFKMPGGDTAGVKDAKGSVKFWIKDGALTKYEFKLKGLMQFGDNEFPNDRTTTVEIKDVGATKVEVPEAAKKKLS